MKISNYSKDALYGELAEVNFINFYKELNKNNNIKILKIEYTETINETIQKIVDSCFLNLNFEETKEIILNKIKNNYEKMIKLNEESIFFENYDTTSLNLINKKYKTLFNKLNDKALFINFEEINLDYRTQKMGNDLIILKKTEIKEEITFLELKSFKAVESMYSNLGLEYFSKWFVKEDKNKNLIETKEEDAIGYSFTMLADILVYRQDINERATKENRKNVRDEIDKIRLKKFENNEEIEDLETITYINVFRNIEFLELAIKFTNNLKLENKFFYHTTKTNNYFSVYTNVPYNFFKSSLIKQYIYKNNEITKL